MSENKYCGNCARFFNEDAKGNGFCSIYPNRQVVTCRHNTCIAHEWKLPKWTEITPENVEEVRKTDVGRLMIAVITHGEPYYMEYREMFRELDEMAKLGGYYYYVLPELKVE